MQTPEETLAPASGSCRDSAWLMVQTSASPRSAGTICVRLSDPAQAGHQIARRPCRSRAGLHRPARLDRGLSAGCRLGRPRSDLGTFYAAKAICRSPRRRTIARPPRSAAWLSRAKVTFAFDMSVARIAEKPRVTAPFSDEAWAAIDALGDKIDADLVANDVRLTMGGEPTFVSVDDYRVGGMEHGGARSDQAYPRRRTDPPAAQSLRAGRPAALRPGQMVSRRAFAALGVLAVLAQRRRADLARSGADRARSGDATAACARRTQSVSPSALRPARNHGRLRAACVRGSGRSHAQARRVAGQHRPGQIPSSTIRWSAPACCVCSTAI